MMRRGPPLAGPLDLTEEFLHSFQDDRGVEQRVGSTDLPAAAAQQFRTQLVRGIKVVDRHEPHSQGFRGLPLGQVAFSAERRR
ncbi:hypothetical protein AN219_38020 [Streptomyces nanshensis]|nr:hypothetical protein AN219_38020 [Streptomyces nanshensis]